MNIKKFTQKDRYGNSVSVEFDVPPMESVPNPDGGHPGQPMGTDTVPAWLTPGEFVMNAEAVRKFKPQLEAMNNHGRVQQKAQGGSIPTYKNMGGVVQQPEGNMMPGMVGGMTVMDPMQGATGPTWNSSMDAMPPQMGVQYRESGGPIDPYAQQIDNETAMFLKQMEELRKQQGQPPMFQQGQEQIPQGQMVGSQGVQPVMPADVPVPVQEPVPQVQQVEQNASPSYLDKVVQVESSGKADAKNPNSSATGVHQFTKGTWIDVIKKYEPELMQGKTEEELLELRKDPTVSTRMAAYLTTENENIFKGKGIEPTDGNLYLAHFAGPSGASRLIQADPSTPVDQILSPEQIKANKSVLEGKTAGEVVAWANAKMGAEVADSGVQPLGIPEVDPNAMVDAQKRREHPIYGRIGGADTSPVPPDTGWGAYEDVGDPNAIPEGGLPETQPEVMADVPVELNKDMNNPEAELGFNMSEEIPKGGRGSEGNRWEEEEAQGFLKNIIADTETPEEDTPKPEEDPETVGNAAPEEDKNKVMSFLEEWGLADLFDKKELGRMAALYLGSRVLGYSHAGSINWAAKQYLTRVDAKVAGHDKTVNELIKGGKYTSSSIKKYQKSKDLNDLVPVGGKYSPTGKTKDILIDGKKVRVREVKGEGENGGTFYQTAQGEFINQLSTKVQDYKPEYDRNTDEYKARMSRARGDSFKTFEEIHKMHAKEKMGEDWVTHVEFGPEAATNDFMEWSESIGLDPESNQARAIMGNAYRQAIADGKEGKIKPTELRPYLEAQFIRETTGTQELFMVNRDEVDKGEAVPKYVRGDKMEVLRANANAIAAKKMPDVSRQTAVRTIFEHGARKWGELTEEERKFYEKSAERGETGFYKFMDEQIQSFVLSK